MNNNTQYERFNSAFNRLDRAISKRLNLTHGDRLNGFKNAIKTGKRNGDKLISNYYERLDVINELRNFVTHESLTAEPIASPSDSIIEEIESITSKISHPKKVRDLFLNDVISFTDSDQLSEALKIVREKNYSQFPVFKDDELVGLVTENGITKYLAHVIEGDLILIEKTSLAEILEADDSVDSYDVIYENKSIYDIEEIFNKQIQKGNTTFILLITKKANNQITSKDDIVGIITPWDIPSLVNNK